MFVTKGTFLIGCLNKTEAVAIFIKVWTGSLGFQALYDSILVVKHSFMHPGDIRMFLAVDVPPFKTQYEHDFVHLVWSMPRGR